MAISLYGDMMTLLSEQQVKAWAEGTIENIRFNPKTEMLTYRLTSQPESRISFKVSEDRIRRWKSFGSPLNTGSIEEMKASA